MNRAWFKGVEEQKLLLWSGLKSGRNGMKRALKYPRWKVVGGWFINLDGQEWKRFWGYLTGGCFTEY